MRRHVIGPFTAMGENWVTVPYQSRHERLQIFQHIRVGIFTQDQTCAGVLAKDVRGPGLDTTDTNEIRYLTRKVVDAPATRLNPDILLKYDV